MTQSFYIQWLGVVKFQAYEWQDIFAMLPNKEDSTKPSTIYNPINIFWKVREEADFQNTDWDKDKDGKLNVSGSKWYTSYTEEMAALKDAYQQTHTISNTEMYLFLLKQGKTDEENEYVLGDMPRGKQFGFLFMEKMGNEQQLLKTIAHELGHGAFDLNHPWQDEDLNKYNKFDDKNNFMVWYYHRERNFKSLPMDTNI